MTVGTNLLVQIFETLAKHDSKEKILRRLYCETGQTGIKSYRFVNDETQEILDAIIPKCQEYKQNNPKPSTIVLVFEELANLKKLDILKETYLKMDGPAKYAYRLCNKKTQHTIQKLGLIQ
jgi:hypothetical protein